MKTENRSRRHRPDTVSPLTRRFLLSSSLPAFFSPPDRTKEIFHFRKKNLPSFPLLQYLENSNRRLIRKPSGTTRLTSVPRNETFPKRRRSPFISSSSPSSSFSCPPACPPLLGNATPLGNVKHGRKGGKEERQPVIDSYQLTRLIARCKTRARRGPPWRTALPRFFHAPGRMISVSVSPPCVAFWKDDGWGEEGNPW